MDTKPDSRGAEFQEGHLKKNTCRNIIVKLQEMKEAATEAGETDILLLNQQQ